MTKSKRKKSTPREVKSPGAILREKRIARGWTMRRHADEAGAPVSSLARIEAVGTGSPVNLRRFARALGLKLDDLFAGSEE